MFAEIRTYGMPSPGFTLKSPEMLIYLDTEFTDFLNIDLISIGMVSEDGQHQFYGERSDFNYDWCNDFVRSAVLAHLGEDLAAKATRDELRGRLVAWFKTLPASVTIACDSFTDYELLLDALDGEKPANLTDRYDLGALGESSVFNQAMCAYHAEPGHPWHHALHDAIGHRMGWMAWITIASTESDRG